MKLSALAVALLAGSACSSSNPGEQTATGGSSGIGAMLDAGDPALEPYPSTECPGLDVYQVPEGTCLLARGSFFFRAGNDCQVSEVRTCAAWGNSGQCAGTTNPLPWLCSNGLVFANLEAADGGTLSVERYEGDRCPMCPMGE